MSKREEAQDMTSRLWAMANDLRGNMDASEFRNYILGFMFYRYLSEHQEQHWIKSKVFDVAEGQSVNDAYTAAVAEDGVDDYLEDAASELGYAIAPEFTWRTITQKVNDSQIKPSDFQDMFDEFDKNAQLNSNSQQDFRGIFNDVNLGNSRLGNSTVSRAQALSQIVQSVDTFDYNDEAGHDILGDVYEYLIAKFAGNSGKKAGEFYTPHEVSKVLARLATLDVQSGSSQFSVYDPTMGSGSLLLTVQEALNEQGDHDRVHFHGQELNTTTYNLARMNLMMHGVEYQNMDLRNGDTLESDWPDGTDADGVDHPRSFDAVVANPPYSSKWDNNANKLKDPRFKDYGKLAPASKADFAFLLHGLYHLSDTGKMAIVLPHGVLFRGAAEGTIRKALIQKNYLDGVIGMPAKLFYSTSIPTTVLVFSKHKTTKDIFFIDASQNFEKGKNQNYLRDPDIDKIIDTYVKREDVDKYAHKAELAEIEENEFNLNIPRYVDTFEEESPVDVDKLVADMQETDKQIDELQSSLSEMLDDLVGQDADAQQQLEALKRIFK
ncbi:site-specific DNA-methyltransferase (adenine-specific) [Levilactobacillus senmaizukei DSM 21775 = NBRC 103853]|uniref:site-specific DNA-methyltransferase (adenine-specific) n=1 Tax=Levilactobacillus senmaizukei DSM 21775 = NBRC 103853 TaxID=1423803 RepID=A0A0R2DKK3_9LACO|nr:type I restriction-modification system subunit M [Levilactobacillus senmaizukei]KRN02245.1 site-specific DNA-methyltransferase (adenine-specific) [Levilactobacillus senmaizukei DSM 21775 = NBRC 103853]